MRACTVIALLILMDSCSIFYGCDSDNKLVALLESTRQWPPYFEGQELIFENESIGAIVQVFEHRDTIEKYERGDECPRGTHETIVARLISQAFQDTITIRLQHQQLFDLETRAFQMRYREADKTLYPANDPDRRHEGALTINGKTYSDVLVAKCRSCDNLSEIIFEKGTGLVAYKLKDTYWTRK